mmetsp:Transcript_12071/g.22664  ORF Transcript_12071/g.22664 Transcript_12071/m.22664 type:complete len:251 (+) Transcript_12071:2851-3603(+)
MGLVLVGADKLGAERAVRQGHHERHLSQELLLLPPHDPLGVQRLVPLNRSLPSRPPLRALRDGLDCKLLLQHAVSRRALRRELHRPALPRDPNDPKGSPPDLLPKLVALVQGSRPAQSEGLAHLYPVLVLIHHRITILTTNLLLVLLNPLLSRANILRRVAVHVHASAILLVASFAFLSSRATWHFSQRSNDARSSFVPIFVSPPFVDAAFGRSAIQGGRRLVSSSSCSQLSRFLSSSSTSTCSSSRARV